MQRQEGRRDRNTEGKIPRDRHSMGRETEIGRKTETQGKREVLRERERDRGRDREGEMPVATRRREREERQKEGKKGRRGGREGMAWRGMVGEGPYPVGQRTARGRQRHQGTETKEEDKDTQGWKNRETQTPKPRETREKPV